jgi:PhoPQ-activated pathogenicity-related protein
VLQVPDADDQPMKKAVLFLLVFCLGVGVILYFSRGLILDYLDYRFVGPASYFDLGEIRDPSTLDLEVQLDLVMDSRARPGKKVRKIQLAFTSQNWHGSVWRHPARIYLPPDLKSGANAGIIATHRRFFDAEVASRHKIPGTDKYTEEEYAEGTALDLGVPIMIFSNPPGRIFNLDESDLMGYAIEMAKKEKDASWFGYLPITTAYLRAITVLSSINGINTERAVLLGNSKRGMAVCLATGTRDSRVAGIMGTGISGGNSLYGLATKFASFGPDVSGPEEKRAGPGFQPAERVLESINSPAGFLGIMAFDPYIFRKKIKAAYFIAVGTNDEFFALGAPNGMMGHLDGDKAFLYIDNLRHTWVSNKHLAAWNMWLAHMFYGRTLPSIQANFGRSNHVLTVAADVSTPNRLDGVRLYFAYNRSLDWRAAQWESVSMQQKNGQYEAVLEEKADHNVAFYVEAEDYHDKGGSGFTSSLVEIIRK